MVKKNNTELLSSSEPNAFECVNAQSKNHLMLICDHASNRVPISLGNLGLTAEQLADHIGWDPGAAAVAHLLSKKLNAPLILSGYSRLVIDCNRPLQSHDSIPEKSADILIPGNQHLTQEERDIRIQQLFFPYHHAIKNYLDSRLQSSTPSPIKVLLSIHSFTPFLFNQLRPWHIGVSFKNDNRLATLMFNALQQFEELNVGFNQPYAIGDEFDYSIPVHGEARGILSIMIEIRQDGLKTIDGIELWANRIAESYRLIEHEIMQHF